MDEALRRRRRVRRAPERDTVSETAETVDMVPVWPADASDQDLTGIERGLRGLVGGGSSQLSLTAAMRARDASRPRPEDLRAAETDLAIIHRHWTPRD